MILLYCMISLLQHNHTACAISSFPGEEMLSRGSIVDRNSRQERSFYPVHVPQLPMLARRGFLELARSVAARKCSGMSEYPSCIEGGFNTAIRFLQRRSLLTSIN